MNRFMIAGTRSGSGKTTVTCAILQALVNRGCDVASFKCGPDYIDPMFHSRIIGADCHNLDSFFCSPKTIRYLLNLYSKEYTLIEGVMGFYDGVKGCASSHQLAVETDTPVILVIDCKGMSDSIGAVMKGFLQYRQPNRIIGFIFNRLPKSLVGTAEALCEEMGVSFLGGFPAAPECAIESRHLGLVTAAEIAGLREKTNRLAQLAETHLKIDRLFSLSRCESVGNGFSARHAPSSGSGIRIAVARDNVFCFYYGENLDLLRDLGCEMIPFSPLRDGALPPDIDGLLIGGGYPELYARELSDNRTLTREIGSAIRNGLPTIAECGGFLYLHEEMQGDDGVMYPMVGVVNGKAFRTQRLQRFGYVTLTARSDCLISPSGASFAAHEFHYWDSASPGEGFTARKARTGAEYACCHATPTLYAGFPHLYFYADERLARRFVAKCVEYRQTIANNHSGGYANDSK